MSNTATAPAADDVLEQADARRQARAYDAPAGLVAIASTVPLSCWGGQEKGWGVYLAAAGTGRIVMRIA